MTVEDLIVALSELPADSVVYLKGSPLADVSPEGERVILS